MRRGEDRPRARTHQARGSVGEDNQIAKPGKPPRPKQQPSFEVCKRNALSKLDKSPKGSLDEPTAPLVHDINRHPDYVTTSSCSGRVSLFATFGDEHNRGGRWLFVQHATVTVRELTEALTPPPTQPAAPPPELVLFKHEPAILHVQCRHLEAAKRLLQVALSAGFRESGLVLSGSEKVMLAIRTTSNSLELPLAARGAMLLPPAYMELLVAQANERFTSNRGRTDALHAAFLAALPAHMAAAGPAACPAACPDRGGSGCAPSTAPSIAPSTAPSIAPSAPSRDPAPVHAPVAPEAGARAQVAVEAAAAAEAAAGTGAEVMEAAAAAAAAAAEAEAGSRSGSGAAGAEVEALTTAASLARAEREVLAAQSKAASAQLIAQGLAVAAMAALLVGALRIRAA